MLLGCRAQLHFCSQQFGSEMFQLLGTGSVFLQMKPKVASPPLDCSATAVTSEQVFETNLSLLQPGLEGLDGVLLVLDLGSAVLQLGLEQVGGLFV